ncbi:MAG: hypothetical protein IT431_08435 [Phycisphaerales bacterium]|nr:hypothetical protein [Phycisphaerales bacterium]
MGLEFAVEQLFATGWSALDTRGCGRLSDGRAYPETQRVEREFADAGLTISIRHIQLFDCYRAEWRDSTGSPAGSVVGHTQAEAAVYALSQMRRAMVAVGV